MRTFLALSVVVLLVGGLSGFAWISRHPEAEWIEQAENWPLVGPAARAFRQKWLAPSARGEPLAVAIPGGEESAGSAPAVAAAPRNRRIVGSMPYEWVTPETVMREKPDPSAEVVERFDMYANLTVIERRGEWVRLRHGERSGWARLPTSEEPLLGSAVAPNLPLPGQFPDARRLAAARRILEASPGVVRERTLGPYRLWTDVEEEALLSWLAKVAVSIDGAYRQRYRCRPIGEPAEAIILFRRPADYREFQALDSDLAGLRPAGHAGYGMVALYTSGRQQDEVAETLAHELTHLLNRRALGPALPAWLDEGLAGDLGGSRIDGRGVHGAELGGWVTRSEEKVTYSGTRAALKYTGRAIAAGGLIPLERLTAMSWRRLVSPLDDENNHAHSALFIRYLLDGEDGALAAGFRGYLASVGQGESASAEALRQRLGRSWRQLDAGFQAWVTQTAMLQ